MSENLDPVHAALQAGNKAEARQLLRPLLKGEATAEAWYVAALAVDKKKQAIECLRRALEVDPWHVEANRLIHRLQEVKPIDARQQPESAGNSQPLQRIERKKRQPEYVRRASNRQRWTLFIVVGVVIMGAASSWFFMNLMGTRSASDVICVVQPEACPVREIDGVPVQEIPDAVLVVEPDVVQQIAISETKAEELLPGFTHEYEFRAFVGQEVAIGIQFLSLNANAVSRNVAIFDPDGYEATSICERNHILEGDNGVAYLCPIDMDGWWRVRLFGREGESTGAYVITMETLDF